MKQILSYVPNMVNVKVSKGLILFPAISSVFHLSFPFVFCNFDCKFYVLWDFICWNALKSRLKLHSSRKGMHLLSPTNPK